MKSLDEIMERGNRLNYHLPRWSHAREIDDALAELEAEIGRGAHPGEIEHIVLRTRPAKNHTSADELITTWRKRAARHGLDPAACANNIGDACGSDMDTCLGNGERLVPTGTVVEQRESPFEVVNRDHPEGPSLVARKDGWYPVVTP